MPAPIFCTSARTRKADGQGLCCENEHHLTDPTASGPAARDRSGLQFEGLRTEQAHLVRPHLRPLHPAVMPILTSTPSDPAASPLVVQVECLKGTPGPTMPRLVLDTQVVMEWLVFRDPGIRPLVEPIEGGRWTWIGSAAMRDELLHVLSRGVAARWNPDPQGIAAVFERLCRRVEAIEDTSPLPLLKCRDKDDQKFIDLALSQKVDALISRDSDVLALSKRARRHGLAILRPDQWLAQQPTAGSIAAA